MSCSAYLDELIERIYIEEALRGSPYLSGALERLPGVPAAFIKDKGKIPPEHLNQRSLFISRPLGETVTPCPGSKGHLCCNYLTVDLYLGCPLGCAYCIMKSYLNFAPITVYLDPEPSIRRLEELARRNADRSLRVGTGEVGDSLLLDPIFELSRTFIRSLAAYPNLSFELKTKTHFVEHLLEIEPKGRAVIGFSLNPQPLISAIEGRSSSLEQRLEAARKAVQSGYRLSFHFDPIMLAEDWQNLYGELAERLGEFPPDCIAWISLGTLRYPPALKDRLEGIEDFLLEEFIPCRDGKYRYLQTVRSTMYRELQRRLRLHYPGPIYLCMESPAVWRNVFGGIPREIPGLSDIFIPAKGIKSGRQ